MGKRSNTSLDEDSGLKLKVQLVSVIDVKDTHRLRRAIALLFSQVKGTDRPNVTQASKVKTEVENGKKE